MTDAPRFIHLRQHTEYSLLEGAVPVKKLAGLCEKHSMPAVAVTDTDNMFCALEFSEYASGAGVQPIIGCQVTVGYDSPAPGEAARPPAPLVLLAQSEAGYENLMKLNTCLYVDKHEGLPQVTLDEIEAHADGLICLSGGAGGPVGKLLQLGHRAEAEALMARLARAYPDRLYVELQRHPVETGQLPEPERLTERGFIEMAYAMALPLVATNDVYFPNAKLYEAHDALICIKEGAYVDQQEPRRHLTPQHYFKSPQEMVTLFADLPEAVENTVEIARRCAFKVAKRDPILPKFADDEVEELRRQAWEGWRRGLPSSFRRRRARSTTSASGSSSASSSRWASPATS
ncbi:MAG: PHP domain-containing protein [Paracoccaceae bacterium]